ncbi:hypothetical protein CC86DRAFT_322180 [Ophiobolus disseminans]|uniref:Uncharacterized protein n=1 Tax=Ophiobolus disseminans TaxID=1469910 RepID=A0A6A7A049_9PLEO|nr:hypothetical protein CC86DRAFT_322180 [Ophiobolus disseminans]
MIRRALLHMRPRPPTSRVPRTRPYTSSPPPATSQSRIARLNRRIPKFLHKHTSALADAPLSHITSFLILHELTAIIPLFSLAAYFHYTHWLPSWFAEGAFVLNGVERFGRYFRKKGWIRSGEKEEAEREVLEIQHAEEEGKGMRKVDKAWNVGEGGVRLVVEFATAYAITKALLVPRIMFSVWATPAFARWTVVPVVGRVKNLLARGKRRGGAGTGAVEGGVVFSLSSTYNNTTTNKMCFDDRDAYTTKVNVRNGTRYSEEYSEPRCAMSWRRRHGLGGSYYPSRYYARAPTGRYMGGALVQSNGYANYAGYPQRHSYPPDYSHYGNMGNYPRGVVPGGYAGYGYDQAGYPRGVVTGGYAGYSSGYGRYHTGARVAMPRHSVLVTYPKPRHQYIYTPRYGQRGFLSYAGQTPNGAAPTGVIPNGGYGGVGVGMGVSMGMGMGMGVAAGGYPGVYQARSYAPSYPYHQPQYPSYYPSYYNTGASYYGAANYYPTPYTGYYNAGLYGSCYPLANFYYPYQRSYYNTVPTYGYSAQAYVYPPGQSATTTTTTYHVTNGHAPVSEPCHHGPTREDVQMESRRVATERGSYAPRRIKPADARSDDPFWCRERNGEWHLRTYYQIENECHPGCWKMDPEAGFLVFHRE